MSNETAKVIAISQHPTPVEVALGQVKNIQSIMSEVLRDKEHYGTVPGCGSKKVLFKSGAEKICFAFRLCPSFKIQETNLPDGHKEFIVTCSICNQSGVFMGEGVGASSTRETKWAKGKSNPADSFNTALKIAKKRAHVDAVLTATAASDIFTQDLDEQPSGQSTHTNEYSSNVDGDPTTHCLFGKNKGKKWSELTKSQLQWYHENFITGLTDASKEQYHDEYKQAIKGIELVHSFDQ